jgi:hypothetical protein
MQALDPLTDLYSHKRRPGMLLKAVNKNAPVPSAPVMSGPGIADLPEGYQESGGIMGTAGDWLKRNVVQPVQSFVNRTVSTPTGTIGSPIGTGLTSLPQPIQVPSVSVPYTPPVQPSQMGTGYLSNTAGIAQRRINETQNIANQTGFAESGAVDDPLKRVTSWPVNAQGAAPVASAAPVVTNQGATNYQLFIPGAAPHTDPLTTVATPEVQGTGYAQVGKNRIGIADIGTAKDPLMAKTQGSVNTLSDEQFKNSGLAADPNFGKPGYSYNTATKTWERPDPTIWVGTPGGVQSTMKESEAFTKGLMKPQQRTDYLNRRIYDQQAALAAQAQGAEIGLRQAQAGQEQAKGEQEQAKAAQLKEDLEFAKKHGFTIPKGTSLDIGGGSITPEAIEMYAQQGLDQGHIPTGVGGFGATGQAVRNQIGNRMAELAKAQGIDNVHLAVNALKNKSDQTSINQANKILTMTEGYEQTVNNYIPTLLQQRQNMNLSKFKKIADFEYAAQKDWLGDPNAQQLYGTLYETLLDYSKVVSGNFGISGLTDAGRKEGQALLNASNNPETFKKVLTNFQNLMKQRTSALKSVPQSIVARYRQGTADTTTPTAAPAASAAKTVVRTGMHEGKKVVQYSDGTIDYAP